MRLFASLACGVAVAGVWSSLAISGEAPARGWMTDFAKAEAEARQLGIPLVVHFYADWCGPCRQMESDVLHQPAVMTELKTRAVGIKVNSDHRADLVTRFGITALPSDVIVGPDGKVLSKTTGAQDLSTYTTRIAGFHSQLAKARAAIVAKKNPPTAPAPATAVAEVPMDNSKPAPVGLEGYSPVALAKDRQWIAGKPEFSWSHGGIEYRMATAEEFEVFKDNPQRYAPQYMGCDPMILATTERTVSGNIKHGAFFRGAVYLFYSEENRGHFLKEPNRYTQISQSIEVHKIELLTER